MIVEVSIPEIGESITEGLLVEWHADDGSVVRADEALFELETEKVTMTVNAEKSGRLEHLVAEGETVEVGQKVGTIDTEVQVDENQEQKQPAAEDSETEAVAKTEPGKKNVNETPKDSSSPDEDEAPRITAPAGMPQAREKLAGLKGLSPAVQRMVVEHHLDPEQIEGSGRDGRLTKGDVLRHLEGQKDVSDQESGTLSGQNREEVKEPSPGSSALAGDARATSTGPGRQSRSKLSPLRRRLAERLVQVQQSAAILSTFNEVDLSRVMGIRRSWRERFKERHGVDLGLMSFFVRAVAEAIQAVPRVNAFIDGDELVENHYLDVGIAVSTEKGLVVPVVRDADQLSMAEIERRIADLAERARQRKLSLEELVGATFTISNGGVFGSLLSTPILNPPGSAILGMHTIQQRPVVVDGEIVVRPMMYLALSYDHRVIDGRESVTFLKRIIEVLENPDRILLGV